MLRIFIKKTVLFGILLFGCISLLKFSVPYYWGNDVIRSKIDYLNAHPNTYDTVIFGSSLVNCHFIPTTFDSNVEEEIKSYNLGSNAMFYLEAEYILENFLSSSNAEYKNVIKLVQDIKPIADINLHSVRSKYFLDFKRYITAINFFKSDWKQIYNYTISFLENKLGVGEIFQILNFHLLDKSKEPRYRLYQKNEGFFDLLQTVNSNSKLKEKVKKRLEKQNSYMVSQQRKRPTLNSSVEYSESDEYFLRHCESLYDKYNRKKSFYFLHLPNCHYYNGLKSSNKLYLGDGADFPEYFELKYQASPKHLNKEGAKIFTRKLAKVYNTK